MKTRLKAKHGMRKLRELERRVRGAHVRVGILGGDTVHPKAENGQTYSEIAFWNELGTNRIPPRPFLSTTMREHKYYRAYLIEAMRTYLLQGETAIRILDILGFRAAADVKEKMTSIMTPPNSAATQKRKASGSHVAADAVNNPLIDSGNLRAAISHEVVR